METIKKTSTDTGMIRLRDLEILRELLKSESVREFARASNTSAGNVSKLVRSLEIRLGFPLLERSAKGIKPTADARRFLPYLEKFQSLQEELDSEFTTQKYSERLTIASNSTLANCLLPTVLGEYLQSNPSSHFRLLEMATNQFLPTALRGGFQVCVHIDEIDWPHTWTSRKIGPVSWSLYGRKAHPLGTTSTTVEVKQFPFVFPTYWSEQGLRYGDDLCPISRARRIIGTETTTATAAIEVVKTTDQLGHFLDLSAYEALHRGEVQKIEVPTWRKISKPLYLAVKNDYVAHRTFQKFCSLIESRLMSQT